MRPLISELQPWSQRSVRLVIGVLIAALVFTLPALEAEAADPRLERAQERRQAVERRLGALLPRLHALEAQTAETEARLNELRAAEAAQQEQANAANSLLALRIRQSYKRGDTDPALALFTSDSPQQAAEQARLLGLLAMRSRAEYETAAASRVRTRVAAGEVDKVAAQLRGRRDELRAARAEVNALLAQAQAQEQQVRVTLAAEEAARQRAARERAAREAAARAARDRAAARAQRPSRSAPVKAVPVARAAAAAAPVVGGVACPVGQPRSYSDTWGAPRSGGRRHKGTDIMAPRGTPIYAYENGTITRLNNSRVGGISIYMRGDSGNVYYYTHLQGYAGGIRPGSRVSVGQHIAYNGDTGNARGLPHLHFEVMPGGGGNVNPYPYVRRACG